MNSLNPLLSFNMSILRQVSVRGGGEMKAYFLFPAPVGDGDSIISHAFRALINIINISGKNER